MSQFKVRQNQGFTGHDTNFSSNSPNWAVGLSDHPVGFRNMTSGQQFWPLAVFYQSYFRASLMIKVNTKIGETLLKCWANRHRSATQPSSWSKQTSWILLNHRCRSTRLSDTPLPLATRGVSLFRDLRGIHLAIWIVVNAWWSPCCETWWGRHLRNCKPQLLRAALISSWQRLVPNFLWQSTIRKRTRRNGSFADVVSIPKTLLPSEAVNQGNVDSADFTLVSESGEHTFATGKILLYPRQGLSVVSDIDDTIKDSQVGDRKELLANTFLRKFRSIDGMADLYRDWAGRGAAFHYVSSSPWQLLEALQTFSDEGGFPDGSMHLRNFRLRDQLLRKLVLRRNGKVIAIRNLLKALPEREFVLIGDSGEKDPKIYRKICKQYPGRVKAVFIRDLDYRRFEPENLAKLARSIPAGICCSYQDSGGLRESAAPLFVHNWFSIARINKTVTTLRPEIREPANDNIR